MSYILKKILNERFNEIYNNTSVKEDYLNEIFDQCSKEYSDYQTNAFDYNDKNLDNSEQERYTNDDFKKVSQLTYQRYYPDITFTEEEINMIKPLIIYYGDSGNNKYLELIKGYVTTIIKKHGYSHLTDFDITRSIEESIDDVALN